MSNARKNAVPLRSCKATSALATLAAATAVPMSRKSAASSQIPVDGLEGDVKRPHQHGDTGERDQIAHDGKPIQSFRSHDIRGGLHGVVADDQSTTRVQQPEDPRRHRQQVKDSDHPGSSMLIRLYRANCHLVPLIGHTGVARLRSQRFGWTFPTGVVQRASMDAAAGTVNPSIAWSHVNPIEAVTSLTAGVPGRFQALRAAPVLLRTHADRRVDPRRAGRESSTRRGRSIIITATPMNVAGSCGVTPKAARE